jgi:hypothetical protein
MLRLWPLAISVPFTFAFFINFCHWAFQCGCRSLWNGADIACNVHQSGGKHCPWCNHGWTGYAVVLGLMLIPQLAVCIYSGNRPWWLRLSLALVCFPLMGGIAALGFGLSDGYWTR